MLYACLMNLLIFRVGIKVAHLLCRHQMETFSTLLSFVWGIHRSPADSPRKETVARTVDVSLFSVWTNCWTNTWLTGIWDIMMVIWYRRNVQFGLFAGGAFCEKQKWLNHAAKCWIMLHCKLHFYKTLEFGYLLVSSLWPSFDLENGTKKSCLTITGIIAAYLHWEYAIIPGGNTPIWCLGMC